MKLSRRVLEQLGALQTSVHELASQRNTALRIFMASCNATTMVSQHEFWLEFAWADQEYRVAVRRLVQFCDEQGERRGFSATIISARDP